MPLSSPSWQKFDAEPTGFRQFYYLFDKDVEPEWRSATYSKLNAGRKMAVRFRWFAAELNNGGLLQYFWNSSGEFAADQITDFTNIGCSEAASILVSVSRKIFRTDYPPVDTGQRRLRIEEYYGTHPFNDDDDVDRLSALEGKDDLRAETNQLDDRQREIAAILCSWFHAHREYFTRLQ